MASVEIPEVVIGVPLFVPDDYNHFSIGAGEGPGGQDCLVVHGNVNRDYKAFQASPVTVPPIFTMPGGFNGSGGQDYSISFWIKLEAALTGCGSDGAGNWTHFLMGAQSATFAPGAASGPASSASEIFSITGYGTDRLTFSLAERWTGTSSNSGDAIITPSLGTAWHLIVATANSNNYTGLYIDDGVVSTGTVYNFTYGLYPPTNGYFFGIGPYSNGGTLQGLDVEHRIFGLAFHDHQLSDTERLLLFSTGSGA